MVIGGSWPDFFPAACPPTEAKDATGEFYRLVTDPPSPQDFVSNKEAGLKKFPQPDWKEKECIACALSIYKNERDAVKCQQRWGNGDNFKFKGKVIAKGVLKPHFGKIFPTPSNGRKSHHSWWMPTNVNVNELIEAFAPIQSKQTEII